MLLLVQFLLRLTFGLALGMAITSPKLVTSGYFRNHLYVTLGLSALAALLSLTLAKHIIWYAIAAAVFSYLGSVYWLFEKSGPGKLMLWIVAVTAMTGSCWSWNSQINSKANAAFLQKYTHDLPPESSEPSQQAAGALEERVDTRMQSTFGGYGWSQFANVSSGLLLGLTMAAMLLGHWYLNAPGMELVPLQKLLLAMGIAVSIQIAISAFGFWREFSLLQEIETQWILFVALRWTFGLLGVAIMTWMAWQTLKIPNTQSATGILYVAVIGTFVGETMALLLSTESLFPL